MADSEWDLAMRRIDMEFDIPQFLASALVRKISANQFQLLSADRAQFQKLPDEVIARIEQIVCEAFLDAGEDFGGDISSEDLWQQALTSRREMIANGDLISEAEFRRRSNLTTRRLSVLLAAESVFTLEVDSVKYFPNALVMQKSQKRSVYAICQIIATAPSDARLDFLTSRRESLGDRSPLEVLKEDSGVETVRRKAAVWAAEWSRTAVKMYGGKHEAEPKDVEPLYTAAAEIDPRRRLWERASEALHFHGYEWPLGPYPTLRKFTLFVERQAAGDSAPIPEACVQIAVDGDYIQVRIVAAPGTTLASKTPPAGKHRTFIDIAMQVIANFK